MWSRSIARGERPADPVSALALPVPSRVIVMLLGIPEEAHGFFEERSAVLIDRGYRATEGGERPGHGRRG